MLIKSQNKFGTFEVEPFRQSGVEVSIQGKTFRLSETRDGMLSVSTDLHRIAAFSTGGVNVIHLKIVEDLYG